MIWIHFHAIWYKYVQTMAYRNNQMQVGTTRIMLMHFHAFSYNYVQPGAARIMWIHFHSFRYNYMQSMAYRNNQMQPGATRIMAIHSMHSGTSMFNQWHTETNRCTEVQLE